MNASTITRAQSTAALWGIGDLSYRLHDDQERVREQIIAARKAGHRILPVLASRRWGKDVLGTTMSVEHGLQQPGTQGRYAAPTQKMVRTIIDPHIRSLGEDAPPHLRPRYRADRDVWEVGDNSVISIAGTDNGGADRLRGVSTDFGVISEAGFVDELLYLIHDVLIPQTATTGGFLLLPSSPSLTPAHPFREFCARAERDGVLIKRTIYDAPHIDEETREELCRIAGGPLSTTWRREYLCEFVADESRAVLPEFPRVEEHIVETRPRPPHFVPLIVADIGYHDLSFVLFGYHDFRNAVDVIEAEYVVNKVTARDIARAVDEIAADLWGLALSRTAARIADAPPIVVAEMNAITVGEQAERDEAVRVGAPLAKVRGWTVVQKTQTDGVFKAAAVNDVRTRLAEKSIRIAAGCEQLRAHCRYGVWRVPGRDLERMEGFGHFDGIDALTYFIRRVDRTSNPYPNPLHALGRADHYIDPAALADPKERALRKLFTRRAT